MAALGALQTTWLGCWAAQRKCYLVLQMAPVCLPDWLVQLWLAMQMVLMMAAAGDGNGLPRIAKGGRLHTVRRSAGQSQSVHLLLLRDLCGCRCCRSPQDPAALPALGRLQGRQPQHCTDAVGNQGRFALSLIAVGAWMLVVLPRLKETRGVMGVSSRSIKLNRKWPY